MLDLFLWVPNSDTLRWLLPPRSVFFCAFLLARRSAPPELVNKKPPGLFHVVLGRAQAGGGQFSRRFLLRARTGQVLNLHLRAEKKIKPNPPCSLTLPAPSHVPWLARYGEKR